MFGLLASSAADYLGVQTHKEFLLWKESKKSVVAVLILLEIRRAPHEYMAPVFLDWASLNFH